MTGKSLFRKDFFSIAALAGGLAAAILSLAALAGWIFVLLALARVQEAFIPMAPATAVFFIVLAAALSIAILEPGRRYLTQISAAVTALAAAFCAFLIYQFLAGIDPGIEHDIFRITGELRGQPLGRMSQVTAVCFLALSVSIFLRLVFGPSDSKSRRASAALSLLVALAGLGISLGYLYGTPALYSGGAIPVAVTTGLAFLSLGTGTVLSCGPSVWPVSALVGDSTRARLMRAILPAATLVILTEHLIEERFIPDRWNQALVATVVAVAAILVAALVIIRISGVIGSSIDQAVTEREQAEQELKRIFDLSTDMICITGFDGRFKKVNPAFTRILGYEREELIDRPFIEFVHPDDIERSQAVIVERLSRGQASLNFESRYRCKDGNFKWLSWNSSSVPGEERIYATARDITQRKEAEEALRASEEKYRNLFENSNVGMYRSALDGSVILDVNRVFAEMYGYTREEMIGRPSALLWADPEARTELARRLEKSGQVTNYEAEFLTKSGNHINVLLSARAYPDQGIIEGANMDITERKQLEMQLMQAQKLESVGRLAGGIAHDFNNYLTAVRGYIELALMADGSGSGALQNDLEEARNAADHAADLTHQLLLFARREHVHVRPVDLNDVVRNLLKLLGRLVGEQYEIESMPEGDLWTVEADPALMEQVIMNLVVNARDAMPGGGKIKIASRNVGVGEPGLRAEAGEAPHDWRYVALSVADTGTGMDSETVAHIFDPFFTTKETGEGTGLGLAVAYGIVQQHHGWIDVESSPGEGSAFTVYVPAVVHAVREDGDASVVPLEELQGKGERILVVEDEDALRRLAAKMLRQNGYQVLTAANAHEARALIYSDGDFQLIFSDIVMPGASGVQMVESIKKERPEMKVLFVTGYSVEANLEEISRMGMKYLFKPYSLRDLLAAVKTALAE